MNTSLSRSCGNVLKNDCIVFLPICLSLTESSKSNINVSAPSDNDFVRNLRLSPGTK